LIRYLPFQVANRRAPKHDEPKEPLAELVRIVFEHHVLMAALWAYQVERPTFDPHFFTTLLEQERKRMQMPKIDIRETSAVLRVLLRHSDPRHDQPRV
jgi:hypothetical protein